MVVPCGQCLGTLCEKQEWHLVWYSTISCKQAGARSQSTACHLCVPMGTWPWPGLTADLGSFECSNSEPLWEGHKSLAGLKPLTSHSNGNLSMKQEKETIKNPSVSQELLLRKRLQIAGDNTIMLLWLMGSFVCSIWVD